MIFLNKLVMRHCTGFLLHNLSKVLRVRCLTAELTCQYETMVKKNEIFKGDGSARMKHRLGKVRLGQVKLRRLPEDSLDIETSMVFHGSTDSVSLSYW